MFLRFLPLISLLCSTSIFATVNGEYPCEQKLVDVELLPEYADFGTPGDLQVVYGEEIPLQCGNEISVADVLDAPTVTYDVKGRCQNVSIVCFDPDTPMPVLRIFLHWFVLNIPADDLKKGYSNEESGDVNAEYFPPGAPTGNHRYTFCVYCQSPPFIRESKSRNDVPSRTGVHPRALAEEYQLGNPLACNFFYAVAADVDTKGVPLADRVKDANKELGNRDKPPL